MEIDKDKLEEAIATDDFTEIFRSNYEVLGYNKQGVLTMELQGWDNEHFFRVYSSKTGMYMQFENIQEARAYFNILKERY